MSDPDVKHLKGKSRTHGYHVRGGALSKGAVVSKVPESLAGAKQSAWIELHFGPDVHKDSITAAIAEGARKGEVRALGKIADSMHALEKLLARIRKQCGKDCVIQVCHLRGHPRLVSGIGRSGR